MGLGLGLRRRMEGAATRSAVLRRLLTRVQIAATDRLPGAPVHPIDTLYGIRTQSPVPLYLLQGGGGSAAHAHMIPYAGCVPGAVRWALGTIPDVRGATFVDLGCGKGRALAIASEFPFRAIEGIELDPMLVAAARRNARRIARRFPDRAGIAVREGDACVPPMPSGDIIIFLYHPFGAPLIERLLRHLADAARPGRTIHVIYENPVHGDVFDAHPAFRRAFAAMVPCDADERRFAFDAAEAIVGWRLGGAATAATPDDAGAAIVVTKPGFRAVVAERTGSAMDDQQHGYPGGEPQGPDAGQP